MSEAAGDGGASQRTSRIAAEFTRLHAGAKRRVQPYVWGQSREVDEQGAKTKALAAWGILPEDKSVSRAAPPVEKKGWASLIESLAPDDNDGVNIRMAGFLKTKATKIAQRTKNRMRWILHPQGQKRRRWDRVVTVVSLYLLIALPAKLAMDVPFSWPLFAADVVVDVTFGLDILVQFSTAVRVERGYSYSRSDIAYNYVTSWFLLDLIASLPVDRVIDLILSGGGGGRVRVNKFVRLFRLARVQRAFRRSKHRVLQSAAEMTAEAMQDLAVLLCRLLLVAHILACLWFIISRCEVDDADSADYLMCGGSSRASKYTASIYFITATMMGVGYGDVSATSTSERGFAMVVQIAGACAFGFIVACVKRVIDTVDPVATQWKRNMDQIREWMRARMIPGKMQRRVLTHFEHFYAKTSVFDASELMRDLPRKMRQEVVRSARKELITATYLLSESSWPEYRVLAFVEHLRPMRLKFGEQLLSQGIAVRELYVVDHGRLLIWHHRRIADKSSNALERTDDNVQEGTEAGRGKPSEGMCLVGLLGSGSHLELASFGCHGEALCTYQAVSAVVDCWWYDALSGEDLLAPRVVTSEHLHKTSESERALLYQCFASPVVVENNAKRFRDMIVDWKFVDGQDNNNAEKGKHVLYNLMQFQRKTAASGRIERGVATNDSVKRSVRSRKKAGDKVAVAPLQNPNGLPGRTANARKNGSIEHDKGGEDGSETDNEKERNTTPQEDLGQEKGSGNGKGEAPERVPAKIVTTGATFMQYVESHHLDDDVDHDNPNGSARDNKTRDEGYGIPFAEGKDSRWDIPSITNYDAQLSTYLKHSMTPEERAIEKAEELVVDLLKRGIVVPSCMPKVTWDLFICGVLCSCVTYIPYRVAFYVEQTPAWTAIDNVVDAMFIMDIFITLNTAYVDENGHLVTVRSMIIRRYARTWLALDIISGVPFDAIMMHAVGSSGAASRLPKMLKAVRLFRILKLLKLLRMAKIKKLLQHLNAYFEEYHSLVQYSKVALILALLAHLIGCLWNFVTQETRHDSLATNWWDQNNIDADDEFARYVAALYYALTTVTTVGYGDIVPASDGQRLLACAIMVMGATVFGYIVGVIGNLLTTQMTVDAMTRSRILKMDNFLSEQGVPVQVAQCVARQADFQMSQRTPFNEVAILEKIPFGIRNEILLAAHKSDFDSVPVFTGAPGHLIGQLLYWMNYARFTAMDFVYDCDEPSEGLYFLVDGLIEELEYYDSGHEDDFVLVALVEKGHMFGYRKMLYPEKYAGVGARAFLSSSCYVLYFADLDRLLEKHVWLATRVRKSVKCVIESQRKALGHNTVKTGGQRRQKSGSSAMKEAVSSKVADLFKRMRSASSKRQDSEPPD